MELSFAYICTNYATYCMMDISETIRNQDGLLLGVTQEELADITGRQRTQDRGYRAGQGKPFVRHPAEDRCRVRTGDYGDRQKNRMTMKRAQVYVNDRPAGVLTREDDGSYTFGYNRDYLQDPAATAVSPDATQT